MENHVTELLGVEYPMIQGGMIWSAGWELASAVSEAGGLGLIGVASMRPALRADHMKKHYRQRPLDLLRKLHTKIEEWILQEAGINTSHLAQNQGLRLVSSKK